MNTVTVRVKDLVKVIEKADDAVRWGSSSWKARKRLLEAIAGVKEESPLEDCQIPACGCPGDRHP